MSVLWYVLVFEFVTWITLTTASNTGETRPSKYVPDEVVLKELVYEMSQTLKTQASRLGFLEKRLAASERRVNLLLGERQHSKILFQKLTRRLTKLEIECNPIESSLTLQSDENSTEISQRKGQNVKSRKERLLVPPLSTFAPSSIAFHAYMSKTLENPGANQILKFDIVKTNTGNGYHSATGVFIAPESGHYVFSWTIRVRNGAYHSTELVVNNDIYDTLYMLANSHDGHVTGVTVAEIHSGDDVFVRIKAGCSNHGNIWNDFCGHSSFKGWKIF